MLSVPMPLMIGLNIGRIFAVLFFLLAAEGRLSGPFPVFAGWGDIITAESPCRCYGPSIMRAPDEPTRSLLGTYSVQPTLVSLLHSASHQRRARPCRSSPVRVRLRCSNSHGRLCRLYSCRFG